MYAFVDRRVDQLSEGSRFFLWAVRAWTEALGQRRCPPGALASAFLHAGVIDALPGFHRMLGAINRDASATLSLSPVACGRIGEHEAVLLQLAVDSLAHPPQARATLELIVDAQAVGGAFEALLVVTERLSSGGLAPAGLQAISTDPR